MRLDQKYYLRFTKQDGRLLLAYFLGYFLGWLVCILTFAFVFWK